MAPVECGILLPKEENGLRSAKGFSKKILGASLASLNMNAGESVKNCKDWRWGYDKHFVKMVELSCKSAHAAYTCAEEGLAYM